MQESPLLFDGLVVRIVDLHRRTDLNGRVGICKWDQPRLRWLVQRGTETFVVPHEQHLKPILPSLHEGMLVRLDGMYNTKEWNGRTGIIKSLNLDGSRYVVQITGVEKMLSVRPENLLPMEYFSRKLRFGDLVYFSGASEVRGEFKVSPGLKGVVVGKSAASQGAEGVDVLFDGNPAHVGVHVQSLSRIRVALPGGYNSGDLIYYIGPDQEKDGNKVRYGMKGTILGPAAQDPSNGVQVMFDCNPGPIGVVLQSISHQKPASRPEKRKMPPLDDMSTLSQFYITKHTLDFDQKVGDGFFAHGFHYSKDPGGSGADRLAQISLESLRRKPMNLETTEVMLVQMQPLGTLLSNAADQISKLTSQREKFKCLAQFVSNQLGGEAGMYDVELTDDCLRQLKQHLNSNVLPLHMLVGWSGVCRHRSLLFKVLCDALGLPCRLVHGEYERREAGGGHAWNIVRVDGVLHLCDVMHSPGTLYKEDSEKAKHYKRLTFGGGHGGVGGASVPIPRGSASCDWRICWKDIKLQTKVGSGGFGLVWKASYKFDDVAVKQLKPDLVSLEARESTKRELTLLRSLRHKHIVDCIGGDWGLECFIVMEYMAKGSLHDCLYRSSSQASKQEFTWQKLGKKILLDAARGLLYLHERSPPITHNDIKPHNVLVSAQNIGKLADMGLSREMANTLASLKSVDGQTLEYAAPEILSSQGSNERSDLFSFGVMLWEVYMGKKPPSIRAPAPRFPKEPSWCIGLLLWGDGKIHDGLISPKRSRRPTARVLVESLMHVS